MLRTSRALAFRTDCRRSRRPAVTPQEDAVAIVNPIANERARKGQQGPSRQTKPNDPQPSKLVEAGTAGLLDVSIHRQLGLFDRFNSLQQPAEATIVGP